MAVRVGPYQRIVGFNWPEDDPFLYFEIFIQLTSGQVAGVHTETKPFDAVPTDRVLASGFVKSLSPQFVPLFTTDIQGIPAPQTYGFADFAFAAGESLPLQYSDYWIPLFDVFDLAAIQGAPLLNEGPTNRGERARNILSFTTTHYRAPFTDTYHYRINNVFFENNCYVQVDAAPDPTGPFSGTLTAVDIATATHDFSTWYYTDGVDTWQPIGLWAYQRFLGNPFFGPSNQATDYTFKLLFKRQ